MKLKEMRVGAGLSRARLAEMAGVTERAIFKWETNGTEKAQLGCIKRVADALGCKVDDLL